MPSAADNPIPLSEIAVRGSARHKAFVEAVFTAGNLVEVFDFTQDDSLSASAFGIEESGLPTLAWGRINKQATNVKTATKAREGWASVVRHIIQADRKQIKAYKSGSVKGKHPWEIQSRGFAMAWGRKFSGDLINGATLTGGAPDPDGFVGFRQMFSSPSEFYIDDSCDIDAGGLDLSQTGITASAGGDFEALIEELCYRMNSPMGEGIKLMTGIELKSRAAAAIKNSGNFATTKDAFGRTLPAWNGATFHTAGVDTSGNDILPGYETAAGAIGTDGSNLFASLYAVNMKEMYNWIAGTLEPENLPQNGVFDERLVDCLFGFLPTSNFWLGRIKNIQVRNS